MALKLAWFTGSLLVVSSAWLAGCTHGPTAAQVSNSVGSTGQFAGSSSDTATSEWMRIDKSARTVHLKLVAGVHGEKSFNGYRNGVMSVVVPPGWKVDVSFRNNIRNERHSAVISPFAEHHVGTVHPAFKGSASPRAAEGTPPGGQDNFSFTADKEGRYAIVCGVKGHKDAGMWDAFVVSGNVSAPRIYVQFEG